MVNKDYRPLVSREIRKNGTVHMKNIGVKKFRNLMKRKGISKYFQVYKIVQMNRFKVN